MRFGLESGFPALFGLDGQPHTLQEIGKEFGVTRERIRQIIKEAIDRMKEMKE